jgi:hypothetical protein
MLLMVRPDGTTVDRIAVREAAELGAEVVTGQPPPPSQKTLSMRQGWPALAAAIDRFPRPGLQMTTIAPARP